MKYFHATVHFSASSLSPMTLPGWQTCRSSGLQKQDPIPISLKRFVLGQPSQPPPTQEKKRSETKCEYVTV